MKSSEHHSQGINFRANFTPTLLPYRRSHPFCVLHDLLHDQALNRSGHLMAVDNMNECAFSEPNES